MDSNAASKEQRDISLFEGSKWFSNLLLIYWYHSVIADQLTKNEINDEFTVLIRMICQTTSWNLVQF